MKHVTARNAFVRTFELLGGVEAMVAWAKEHPSEFYPLMARLIPAEIADQHGVGEPIKIVVYAPQSTLSDKPLELTPSSSDNPVGGLGSNILSTPESTQNYVETSPKEAEVSPESYDRKAKYVMRTQTCFEGEGEEDLSENPST